MSPEIRAILDKARQVLERQRALAEKAKNLHLKARALLDKMRRPQQEEGGSGEPEGPRDK